MDSEEGCSVGFNVGGIIYKTYTSTLMKDRESFFSRMIHLNVPYSDIGRENGQATEKTWSREDNSWLIEELRTQCHGLKDSHGNFVIERDGSLFNHVLAYLKKGVLFSDLDVPTLEGVKKEAVHYKLVVLHHQIQSILAMRDIVRYEHPEGAGEEIPQFGLQIHVYRWVNGPCVVFATKSSRGNLNVLNVGELCKEDATICGGVFVGIAIEDKMMPLLENNVQGEIVEFNGMRLRSKQLKIKNCTKIILSEINEGYIGEPWVPM